MTQRAPPPPGLLTPVLAEDLSDGIRRPQTRELTWLQRPTDEPSPDDDPTVEVEVP